MSADLVLGREAGLDTTPQGTVMRASELPCVEPWGVIVDRWINAYTSPRTREGYTREARLFTSWCIEQGIDPLTARRHDIEDFRNGRAAPVLAVDGTVKRKADSARTVGRRLAALSSLYDYAGGCGAGSNPVTGVRRPKIDRKSSPSQSLEHEEVRPLLAAAKADSPRSGALVALLLLAGLRVSEALAANIEDLGWDKGHRTLTIRAKGGAEVKLPLAAPVAAAVTRAVGDRTSGPILATSTGNAMDRRHAHRTVRRLAGAAGVNDWEHIGPHDLRHTAVTGVLNDTGSIDEGQRFARHASPVTTQTYDHRDRDLDDHPSYGLAAFFAKPRPKTKR